MRVIISQLINYNYKPKEIYKQKEIVYSL